MAVPRVLVLRAPGTNCDVESAFAFELAGARTERRHINQLLAEPRLLADFQVLCLPGGFSYGDDLAAGRILGNQLRHHLDGVLGEFRDAGKLILGICNGFQVLMRTSLLLPERNGAPQATLTLNRSGKFEDRWVQLATHGSRCVFFQGIESMYLPVAHAEGRFVFHDEQTLARLEAAGQLALRYRSQTGATSPAYPDNPNGAMADVAGICDESGRVCGLMPHPERHVDPTQHPRWTREPSRREGDGLAVFRNAVRYFA
ncbi:MAG: phosphoribosylformylglycinamidine synthase I [Pirellulales bacterium]|nr:phosphoribosylformylglycinamidine synthase I [Pirellulales bacterium]